MEDGIVRLEPLALCHEEGLCEVVRDVRVRRWVTHDASVSRKTFRGCVEDALATSKRERGFAADRAQKEVTI